MFHLLNFNECFFSNGHEFMSEEAVTLLAILLARRNGTLVAFSGISHVLVKQMGDKFFNPAKFCMVQTFQIIKV